MKDNSKTPADETSFGNMMNDSVVAYRVMQAPCDEATEESSWADFRDQCRRQMRRPLEQRIKYGFCRMHKPVLDDAPWRSFKTMAEYRAWCEANLPDYLGFKRPTK